MALKLSKLSFVRRIRFAFRSAQAVVARVNKSKTTAFAERKATLICTVVAWGMFALLATAQQNTSTSGKIVEQPFLVNAHAHNDYLHPRPLLDALEQGFGSVEADVFLVDGKLLVAHSILEIRHERTLEDLYLKPLAARCDSNGGRVFR